MSHNPPHPPRPQASQLAPAQRLEQTRELVIKYTMTKGWPVPDQATTIGSLFAPQTAADLFMACRKIKTSDAPLPPRWLLSLAPLPFNDQPQLAGFLEELHQALPLGSQLRILLAQPQLRKIYYEAYERYGFAIKPPHQISEGARCQWQWYAGRLPEVSQHLIMQELTMQSLWDAAGFRDWRAFGPNIAASRLAREDLSFWHLLLENPPFFVAEVSR